MSVHNDSLAPPDRGAGEGSQNSDGSNRSNRNTTDPEGNTLPASFQLRINQQLNRVEALETMFHEGQINREHLGYLEVLDNVELVESMHDVFTKEHFDLIAAWPPAHSGNQYFRQGLFKTELKLYRQILKILRGRQEQLEEENSLRQQATSQPIATQPSAPEFRAPLPKIELPKFNGDYTKWPEFKVIFEDLVINTSDISDSAKLHYLKAAVSNSKADIISKITS